MSPIIRQLTVPVGRTVRYVKLQLNGQNRNQASGGNCNALCSSSRSRRLWKKRNEFRIVFSSGKSWKNQLEYRAVGLRENVPTHNVSYDIGVTNNDFKFMLHLLWYRFLGGISLAWLGCSMQVFTKCSFNPRM
jgi:hypothetical protein